jgi:dynein heavy chain
MERASLRAECKRLTRFLRLVDIMMAGFLKSIVLEAIETLVQVLNSVTLEPFVELSDSKALFARRNEKKLKQLIPGIGENVVPLFEVSVSFLEAGIVDAEGYLKHTAVAPGLEVFSKAIDLVINGCIDMVSSFTKVFSAPETEQYVMPMDGGEDDAEREDVAVDIALDIRQSSRFKDATFGIDTNLKRVFESTSSFINIFEFYIDTFLQDHTYAEEISSRSDHSVIKLNKIQIDHFKKEIERFHVQKETFMQVPVGADVGVLYVTSVDLKKWMLPAPDVCLDAIRDYLPELAAAKVNEMVNIVAEMNPILSNAAKTVEQYVLKKKTKDMANRNLVKYKEDRENIDFLINILSDNAWPIPENLKATSFFLKKEVEELEANISIADSKEDEETKKFRADINSEYPQLTSKIKFNRGEVEPLFGDPSQDDEKVKEKIKFYLDEAHLLKDSCDKLEENKKILGMENVEFDFEEIHDLLNDLNLKKRLWEDKGEWARLKNRVMDSPISTFDVLAVEKDVKKIQTNAKRALKDLPTNKVLLDLLQSVQEFSPILPVVNDLRNPCLKDRHWVQIKELTGIDFLEQRENFTLIDLIANKVTDHYESITGIATSAQQENILENLMDEINLRWKSTEFEVKSYKDNGMFILGDTSNVISDLDDSLVTINTILGSRYVGGIRKAVDELRSTLMLFQETLDEWLTCQKNWMYLETIFNSPDIQKQLPVAAKKFQTVDRYWRVVMKATNESPKALEAGTKDKSRLTEFRKHNLSLDEIQKELEDYLETKKKAFPRFYFLSNDELLEILSQAKDPRAVQPHLRKCFDNLVKLDFGDAENSVDIFAMFSGENEKVVFPRPLKAFGNVESWLKMVEENMKSTLRKLMKGGLLDYDTKARDEWVAKGGHPGQVIATVAQMTWARETETALKAMNPIDSMEAWSVQYKEDLQKLIIMIRGSLSKLVRNIIVALVTTDVHARDIIDELREKKVTSVNDFLWQQQLRYYWNFDPSVDDCIIKHSDALIRYGYEYMGATSRLVITPLTDRCNTHSVDTRIFIVICFN